MKNAKPKALKFFIFLTLALFILTLCGVAGFSLRQMKIADSSLSAELAILQQAIDVDAKENFKFVSSTPAAFGKVYRFQQISNGLTVDGAQITVSVDEGGNILSTSGKYVDVPASHNARISASQALKIASGNYQSAPLCFEDCYFFDGVQVYPVYKIGLENDKTAYVSKQNGDIIYASRTPYIVKQNINAFGNNVSLDIAFDGINYLLKDDDRKIYICDSQGEPQQFLNESAFLRAVYSSENGEDFDPMAVSAFDGILKAYDFYTDDNNIGQAYYGMNGNNNNLNKFDDYKLYVFLNYNSNYPSSAENNNASYSAQRNNIGLIFIGNGVPVDGNIYMQGRALDIIAHEYQHGVTAHTAGLNYNGESGALDEAFSDIFGSLIEGNDPSDLDSEFWTIGENGVYDPFDLGKNIRSLIGGTSRQAYNMSEKYTCRHSSAVPHDDNCDYGRVHANSTIISRVQYELSSLAPSFFTRQNIGKLWFSTLLKLTPNATFIDFATAFLNSSAELDFSDEIQQSVRSALLRVGILDDDYYTVTFKDEFDATLSQELVKKGDFVLQPNVNDIQEENFTFKFDYWADESGKRYERDELSSLLDFVNSDLTLVAHYKKVVYASFFDVNGSLLQKTEYPLGAKASAYDYAPASDQYDYKFLGWTSSSLDEGYVYNFENLYLSQNTDFIPYVLKMLSLYFYDGDDKLILSIENATEAEFENFKFSTLSLITPLKSETTAEVFAFSGWDSDLSFSKLRTGSKITALFTSSPRPYVISFVSDGREVSTSNVLYGDILHVPSDMTNLQKKGYILDGWYLDEACTIKATNINILGDMTLYAKWLKDEVYFDKVVTIGVFSSLAVLFIISIPLIILFTKRRKR